MKRGCDDDDDDDDDEEEEDRRFRVYFFINMFYRIIGNFSLEVVS